MSNKEDMNLPARPTWDHVDMDRDENKKRSDDIERKKEEYEERQRKRQDEEQIQRLD